MKKYILGICLLVISHSLFGACKYEKNGRLDISFKAYKTPLKIGVGGTFNTLTYKNPVSKADTLRTLLKGASVYIDTASVYTKNAPRDKKIATYFFHTMVQKGIDAKIIGVETKEGQKGILDLDITMNGVTHNAQMRFIYEKGLIKAQGTIDLSDFHALHSLASLNKACYALHKGKTWSDVTIGFTLPVKKECR
jgi:hypothetical protein